MLSSQKCNIANHGFALLHFSVQLPWSNVMRLLTDETQDSEVLVYAMTLINKVSFTLWIMLVIG